MREKKINKYLNWFYKNINNSNEKLTLVNYQSDIDTPKLSTEQKEQCKAELKDSEVREALSKMENNKLIGNDGNESFLV